MYLALVITTAAVLLGGIAWAYTRHRDPFHPLVLLGPMWLLLYVGLPLRLYATNALDPFFSWDQLLHIQLIVLLGCIALVLGCQAGAGPRVRPAQSVLQFSRDAKHLLRILAMAIGVLGLLAFLGSLAGTGGLIDAYSRSYGGGFTDSGYVRDGYMLVVPAILLWLASRSGESLSPIDWGVIAGFCFPLVIQSIFGSRRGPLFMLVSTLFFGWYLIRHRRPRLPTVIVGGCLLGWLLLFIVVNRGELHFGSDWRLSMHVDEYFSPSGRSWVGNEYLYGGAVMLNAEAMDRFYWGRRYLTILFVRPIPRAIWPTKYADVGMEGIETNLGEGTTDLRWTVGWKGGLGATPGLIADMWIEFWWGCLPALFGIAWLFGRAWRTAIQHGRFWIIGYALMCSFSLYLCWQSLEACLFRVLFTGLTAWAAWKIVLWKEGQLSPRPSAIPMRGWESGLALPQHDNPSSR